MSGPTAILLITCRDRPGLVASISDFVYRNGGNIVHADQHTDTERGLFLQRVEWEIERFLIPRQEIAAAFRPMAEEFALDWHLAFSDEIPKMAVLVSREGHCLQDLVSRWQMGEFPARLTLVISNHSTLAPLAEGAGITFTCLPVEPGHREAQEARVQELLNQSGVDLVVLARYMQVLSPQFVAAYQDRIINIHHSFLPAFAGGRPYHQAYERGVKIIGATAHYVTDELDQGPIIEQDVVRVSHRDTVADLIRKGKDLERVVLARAVRAHLLHRVLPYENRTVVFD